MAGDLPDVRFSHASADELARELSGTARALAEVLGQLHHDLPLVREDWRGRHRDSFEVRLQSLQLGLGVLAETLGTAAGQVRALALEATAENLRRARGREDGH